MHNLTMPAAATSFEPVQVHASLRLLYALIREPARYEELFERYAGAVITRLAYGKKFETAMKHMSGELYKSCIRSCALLRLGRISWTPFLF